MTKLQLFVLFALCASFSATAQSRRRYVRLGGEVCTAAVRADRVLSLRPMGGRETRLRVPGAVSIGDISPSPPYLLLTGEGDSGRSMLWIVDCSNPSSPDVSGAFGSEVALSSAALVSDRGQRHFVGVAKDFTAVYGASASQPGHWDMIEAFGDAKPRAVARTGADGACARVLYERGLGEAVLGTVCRSGGRWQYTGATTSSPGARLFVRGPLRCQGEIQVFSNFAGSAVLETDAGAVVDHVVCGGSPAGGTWSMPVDGLICGQRYRLRATRGVTSGWFRPFYRQSAPRSVGGLDVDPLSCAPSLFYVGSNLANCETVLRRRSTRVGREGVVVLVGLRFDDAEEVSGVLVPQLVRVAPRSFRASEVRKPVGLFLPVPDLRPLPSSVWVQVVAVAGEDVACSDIIGCDLDNAAAPLRRKPGTGDASDARRAIAWRDAGVPARLDLWAESVAPLRK